MIRRFALAALVMSAPAAAVGLAPLAKQGLTDGPQKGFYLTVINPYAEAHEFRLEALSAADERPQERVRIFPDKPRIGARGQRRVLVVAGDLQPGETFEFRVCAERAPLPMETIHARVCSKLGARRVPRI